MRDAGGMREGCRSFTGGVQAATSFLKLTVHVYFSVIVHHPWIANDHINVKLHLCSRNNKRQLYALQFFTNVWQPFLQKLLSHTGCEFYNDLPH